VLRTLNRIGMVIDKDKDSSRMSRKEGGWAWRDRFLASSASTGTER
jgi:hypothetical protein